MHPFIRQWGTVNWNLSETQLYELAKNFSSDLMYIRFGQYIQYPPYGTYLTIDKRVVEIYTFFQPEKVNFISFIIVSLDYIFSEIYLHVFIYMYLNFQNDSCVVGASQ